MKKTKIFAAIAAIAAAVCIGLFAGCGGNYSETYNGALSEKSYASEETAAKAFLDEEVKGDDSAVVYSKVDVEEDALSDAEVEKLEIEDKASVEYVKKATVYYTQAGTQTLAAATEGNSELSKMLYLVKYVGGGFKYYSPALASGESLTKSYFNDVMNPDRYENVTVTGSVSTVSGAKVSYQGQSEDATATVEMDYTYQVTKNAVYLKVVAHKEAPDPRTGKLVTEDKTQDGYLVATNKGYVLCAGTDGAYQVSGMEVENGSDMIFGNVLNGMDHSYFMKTNSGFQMDKDACIEMMKKMYGDMFEQYKEEFGAFEDLIDDMQFDFYVTEGNVSGVKEKLSLGLSVSEQGMSITVTAAASADYSFKNFGTTTVTVPDDVKAAITAKGYTLN